MKSFGETEGRGDGQQELSALYEQLARVQELIKQHELLADANRIPQRPEVKTEIDQHYEWTRAHMSKYLTWVIDEFGSLQAFEAEIASHAQLAVPETEESGGTHDSEQAAA